MSTTFTTNLLLKILPQTTSNTYVYGLKLNVVPANVPNTVQYPITLRIKPQESIPINLSYPILQTAYSFVDSILANYIDEDRELKTLLNYGDDRQAVIISSRYGTPDRSTSPTVQLKLLNPVPNDIGTNTSVFLSREVAKTLIDKVRTKFAPEIDTSLYLRPKNTLSKATTELGKTLNNVTLNILQLQTGSFGKYDSSKNVSFEDNIYRRWYSYDFNSSELNIDFTDYNNFVFYGSAAMRLAAFAEKLRQIDVLTTQSLQFAGTVFTGSLATAGATYVMEQSAKLAKDKENIIRSFDRYEQYLYFTPSGSDSPYTASAYYTDTQDEYNNIAYWPKDSSGSLYMLSNPIAEEWFVTQSAIAQRFDEFNVNNLVNTIPTHIREDQDSDAYITFVAMIGHFFDTIKPYVDQFPQIYDRYINPNTNLSKDLVSDIAESLGFTLPTINSLYSLSDDVIGTTSEIPRRDYTVQTYKRILHNLPLFAKTKGTRTALVTFLKTLGLTEQIINVRESGLAETGSLYVFDEFSSGIKFTGTPLTFIKLPITDSNRTPAPRSLQLNMTLAEAKNMTVLTGDQNWALHVKVHPTISTLGRFELTSGSTQTLVLSSSYQPIFTDDLLNVSIRTYPTGSTSTLFVAQTVGEDIIFTSSMSETGKLVPMWSSSKNVYVGGSGSLIVDYFKGTVDEVRLWGTNLSNEVTLNSAFDPGSNAGDTFSDAVDYLYVQLSFDKIVTASLPSYLINESPYKFVDGSPSLETIEIAGITLPSFTRYSRQVRQILPSTSTNTYVTRKIKIAPPAQFTIDSITPSGVKQLSRTRSIVRPQQKPVQLGRNKVIISTSPTEIVNQNIIRNLGLENINSILAAPSDLYNTLNTNLTALKKYYSQYYYVSVDFNKYIRILSEVNSILNQVVGYFIPSKATVLQGIVIEPNILERVNIPPLKALRLYGKNARKTLNAPGSLTGSRADFAATYNVVGKIDTNVSSLSGSYSTYTVNLKNNNSASLEASVPVYSASIEGVPVNSPLTSSYATYASMLEVGPLGILIASSSAYGGTIERNAQIRIIGSASYFTASIDNIIDAPSAQYVTYDLQHLDWLEYRNISNSFVPGTTQYVSNSFMPHPRATINMHLDNMNKFPFNSENRGSPNAEPYNRVYARKLYDYEIDTIKSIATSGININALYEIPPSADFDDIGTYTYFNSPSGLYYFPELTYTPRFPRQLNQTWNGEYFVGATTWSYGQRYNYNDVVYQSVDNTYTVLGSITASSVAGNGQYYVFNTRPAYVPPSDGTSFYSGSVPTYIPPSLDRVNWQRLRFRPTETRVAKRTVFDTFVVPDPSLNNFKITILDKDKVVDIPTRYVDFVTVGNIESGSYVSGEISLQNIAILFALQTNSPNIRVRLYRTLESRNADLSRLITQKPEPDAGVLLDTEITNNNQVDRINPFVSLIADSNPPLGKIFYTINNNTSTPKLNTTLGLYYFAVEVEPRIPSGYLRKHYRFFRDNSTATKRRNYEGCKNTVDTTIDGLSPVQIFVGEGTSLVIAPTQTNNELVTGGGGVLDVM